MDTRIKRILSFAVAFFMVIGMMPVNVVRAEGTEGDDTEIVAETTAPETTPHVCEYAAVVTAPTCEAAGFTTYTCSCGDTYTADEVEATGHTYGEDDKCACGALNPAHEHSYTSVVTAPTCDAAGYTTNTCACGDVTTTDEVAATGHTYGEDDKCACGALNPAHEHSYTSVVTAPTCDAAGYTTNTCVCGDVTTTDEVEATGHTYGEDDKCACGALNPAHEHSYTSVVTAPTCDAAGYTTNTCACGDVTTTDEVEATGHAYGENGKCACGALDPAHEHAYVEGECVCGDERILMMSPPPTAEPTVKPCKEGCRMEEGHEGECEIICTKDERCVLENGHEGRCEAFGGVALVEPTGTLNAVFVSENTYWGECGGNASESFMFKFYNDSTYMGYTSLNNIDGIIDGDVYVSWSIKLDAASNTDEYWDMAWEVAPTLDMQPNRVEQWVDGVKVAEATVQFNAPDDLHPIVVALADNSGKVIRYLNSDSGHMLEDAFAAAANDSKISHIGILKSFAQNKVKDTQNYYDVKHDLTISAEKAVVLSGCGFAVRILDGATLAIDENVTIEGLDVFANGFATTGENLKIDGTIKALSLKQWTNNGTIVISQSGSVELGYGDGQFDMAYGNGSMTVTGTGNKTNAQFKAGYAGTRGNGNTLNLKDTYFESGRDFTIGGSNGTFNLDNALMNISGGDFQGDLTASGSGNIINLKNGAELRLPKANSAVNLNSSGNEINLTNGSKLTAGNLKIGEGNKMTMDATSSVKVTNLSGAGEVVIDGTGMTAENIPLTGNAKNFTGNLTLTGDTDYFLEVAEDGTIVFVMAEAKIGKVRYRRLAEAVAALQEGETLTLLSDATLTETAQLPANVTIEGNGISVTGTLSAGGDVTFVGHTKVTAFNTGYSNRTFTIGEGACLEITGTDRVTIGYGNIFNITGTIAAGAAKTADKATVMPSLIVPGGFSITGGSDATFNVTNAYITAGNTSSKNSAANGTFNLNFNNSIVDFTSQFTLAEPTGGNTPTFNVSIKDSVFTTAAKICLAAPNSNVLVDNSTVSGQYLRNSGELTLQNGSTFTAATIQFGENGGNNGTITVDKAQLTINGGNNAGHAFDGKGVGKLILKNGATAKFDYIKDHELISVGSGCHFDVTYGIMGGGEITVDGTGMTLENPPVKGNAANYTGKLTMTGDTDYFIDVRAEDETEGTGKKGDVIYVLGEARIGKVRYRKLTEAVAALQEGETLTLLSDATFSEELTIPANVTIEGNGVTLDGTIYAGGNLTFVGKTRIKSFSATYYDRTITIGEGACLDVYGTSRVSLAYGNTFNITGSIAEGAAKTTDKATVEPSLIFNAGISITGGNDATFNVTNAYIRVGNTSTSSSANGKFTMNFNNSIAEFTHQFALSEPGSGKNPSYNLTIKDSVFTTTGYKIGLAAPNSNVLIDNATLPPVRFRNSSGALLV